MKSKQIKLKIYKKVNGFTLAEVLVTIAIIGVVSSITIPNLVQNIQNNEYKVAYKKAFAAASQAIINANNNDILVPRTSTTDKISLYSNFNSFKGQFNIAIDCNNNNNNKCWDENGEKYGDFNAPYIGNPAFVDNSGVAWSIADNENNYYFMDTNGFKPPNRFGKDRWIFTFGDQNSATTNRNEAYNGLGVPVKVVGWNDITAYSVSGCQYPPCYYKSWLTGTE